MSDVVIYRIENADGDGPYNPSRGLDIYECPYYPQPGTREEAEQHPAPAHDSALVEAWAAVSMTSRRLNDWRYGFASVAQLRRWFADDRVLEWLQRHGYHLATYTVRGEGRVVVGHSQVMYADSFADRTATAALDTLIGQPSAEVHS